MDDLEEPRWLDGEEQQSWFAFAYMLIRLPAALEAQMQRDANISQFDYLVLAALSMVPDRTQRMSDLADATASSLGRLSNVVIKLERRGWVRRTPDPIDGRYTLAILTDDGWDKVVTSAPGHVNEVRRLVFDPLTKAQQRQMGAIGQRILQAIDPELLARIQSSRDSQGEQ
ncbi:MarR family winged helix-turn-helix transcriptional regulator [Phytohabitans rumicis]|uniref:MarR family transcriptional regulator n=1 Tax=Phytohabitans rumicis TaxID=1076125 RepID=A0A6V8KWA3_9ACTN|nr:MarR family winged helix-turn-helix transcriptional regulator [Phytohabitans rumicis]GFJ87018.1 MarR family transcriptional regulator [Phytohabitans rumicis]